MKVPPAGGSENKNLTFGNILVCGLASRARSTEVSPPGWPINIKLMTGIWLYKRRAMPWAGKPSSVSASGVYKPISVECVPWAEYAHGDGFALRFRQLQPFAFFVA